MVLLLYNPVGMAAPSTQGGEPTPVEGRIDGTQLPVVVGPPVTPALGPVLVKSLGPDGKIYILYTFFIRIR